MQVIANSNRKLLLFFLVSAVIFKMLTFFFSVIDIDESTYLLIGKEIFKGNWLYVDYYDTKPPGIFLIFGFIELITAHGIFFTRLLAALLVGITSYLLFKLKLKISGNRYASIFAGLAYLILASMYRFTFAANTEIFFIFFTILAFNIFFSNKGHVKYFLGGLMAGIGFTIKYVVAFDILAYGAFLTYLLFIKKMPFKEFLKAGILILLGLIIPISAVALTYALAGHFHAFQQFAFSFLVNYQDAHELKNYWDYILDIHLKYLPAFVFFYYLLYRNVIRMGKHPVSFFAVGWVIMVYLSVFLQKKSITHYSIQVFPVMAFVLADIFILPNKTGKYIKKYTRQFFVRTFGILLIINLINQSYYLTRRDIPREIAAYIEPRLDKDDIVYVPAYKHIIYYLLDQPPPTPWVHPTLFAYRHHKESLGIDVNQEVEKILQKEPEFVAFRIDPYMYEHKEYFYEHYEEVKAFGNKIFLYKRK